MSHRCCARCSSHGQVCGELQPALATRCNCPFGHWAAFLCLLQMVLHPSTALRNSSIEQTTVMGLYETNAGSALPRQALFDVIKGARSLDPCAGNKFARRPQKSCSSWHQHLECFHAECQGDALHVVQCRIAKTSLYMSNEGSVKARLER